MILCIAQAHLSKLFCFGPDIDLFRDSNSRPPHFCSLPMSRNSKRQWRKKSTNPDESLSGKAKKVVENEKLTFLRPGRCSPFHKKWQKNA